jgi:membrane protein DedA with SNARE-associated domain
MLRSGTAAVAHVVPALLHLHVHLRFAHRFHGPPVDYAGLAVAAAASWIGVPGPGEPVLIAAGVLAAKHKLDLASVLVVAWAAATAGGVAGWAIGLKAGRTFLTAPGPLRSARIKAVDRGEAVFTRYPVIAIVLTPSWIAGIHRVRPAIYHPTNVVSAALWAAGLGLGGYFAGPAVIDVVGDLGTVAAVAVGLVIAAAVVLELRRRRHRARG